MNHFLKLYSWILLFMVVSGIFILRLLWVHCGVEHPSSFVGVVREDRTICPGRKDTYTLSEVNKNPIGLNLNWKFLHELTYFIFKKRSISWFGPIKRLGDNGNHQNPNGVSKYLRLFPARGNQSSSKFGMGCVRGELRYLDIPKSWDVLKDADRAQLVS